MSFSFGSKSTSTPSTKWVTKVVRLGLSTDHSSFGNTEFVWPTRAFPVRKGMTSVRSTLWQGCLNSFTLPATWTQRPQGTLRSHCREVSVTRPSIQVLAGGWNLFLVDPASQTRPHVSNLSRLCAALRIVLITLALSWLAILCPQVWEHPQRSLIERRW